MSAIPFNQTLFDEYALDVGISTAVDVARASGVPADRINRWMDDLTRAMMEDVAADIEASNRIAAARMTH